MLFTKRGVEQNKEGKRRKNVLGIKVKQKLKYS